MYEIFENSALLPQVEKSTRSGRLVDCTVQTRRAFTRSPGSVLGCPDFNYTGASRSNLVDDSQPPPSSACNQSVGLVSLTRIGFCQLGLFVVG